MKKLACIFLAGLFLLVVPLAVKSGAVDCATKYGPDYVCKTYSWPEYTGGQYIRYGLSLDMSYPVTTRIAHDFYYTDYDWQDNDINACVLPDEYACYRIQLNGGVSGVHQDWSCEYIPADFTGDCASADVSDFATPPVQGRNCTRLSGTTYYGQHNGIEDLLGNPQVVFLDGEEVRCQASGAHDGDATNTLYLDRNLTYTISGGWNLFWPSYYKVTGEKYYIKGDVVITDGVVTMEDIVITGGE